MQKSRLQRTLPSSPILGNRCYYQRSLGESPQPGNPIVRSPFKCISCANFQPQSQATSWNKLCYLHWNIFVAIHSPHGRSQTGVLTDLEELQSHSGFTASSYCTNTDLFSTCWASLVAQTVKNLPSLGQEDILEKGMTTHSSILVWKIPRTEEPGRLQPMGSQELGTTD